MNQLHPIITSLCEYLVESINWNFKLTKAMYCNTYIVLSFYIMIDIFVAAHEACSYIKWQFFMNVLWNKNIY